MSKETFRQLSDEEKKFTEANLKGREEELSHMKLMVEYNDFMIDRMLYSNYLEKQRGYAKQNRDFKAEVVEIEAIIKVTKKQLVQGVKIIKQEPSMVN